MYGVGGNLSGYRVLDCTTEPGFLAGKLLGDLGADVIKVEPPGGDLARRRAPFLGGTADPEASILWLALNTSKRGITLDLGHPEGRDLFLRLCGTADAVIECRWPRCGVPPLAARGLDWDTLRGANPKLVSCEISPFGQEGPYAGYRASDITLVAMGGNMYPTGDPDRPPVRCALPVSYFHVALDAATAIAFAFWAREQTGEGQRIDVSAQEAVAMANMTGPAQFPHTRAKGTRTGAQFRGGKTRFRELWPCRDGWVSFALRGGPARIPGIRALIDYMDENGMAPEFLTQRDWSAYNHNLVSQEEVDAIESAIGAFFRTKTMAELFEAACARHLMLAPANTAREILASEQLRARGFFVKLDDPARGARITYPGAFAKSTAGPIGPRCPAPRLGEHNAAVYAELGLGARDLEDLMRRGIV